MTAMLVVFVSFTMCVARRLADHYMCVVAELDRAGDAAFTIK